MRPWMRASDVSKSRTAKPSNTEKPAELADVGERFDPPQRVENPFGALGRHAPPGGALPELVGELRIAHRIRRAALAEVGATRDVAAVGKLDVDDRRHLVEAGG